MCSGDCYWLLVCSGVLVCSGISTKWKWNAGKPADFPTTDKYVPSCLGSTVCL